MELYFSPMACSLATRIALYEAGVPARYTQVDTRSKRTANDEDYWQVTPMGQVPALRTDEGVLITENAAVLQYVAERYPRSGLLPEDALGRARLRQWLCLIGTELHKAVFLPLLDPNAPPEVQAYARGKAVRPLGVLQAHLAQHQHLLDAFSVADAYLATVLNWASVSGIDLTPWPALQTYHGRMMQRPQLARAVAEEFDLYKAEKARAAMAT